MFPVKCITFKNENERLLLKHDSKMRALKPFEETGKICLNYSENRSALPPKDILMRIKSFGALFKTLMLLCIHISTLP